MQIMMFTGDSPQKILSGDKTMTARCWKRKPPKVGTHVRAQTGRKKTTSFAILEILDIQKWDGSYEWNDHPEYLQCDLAEMEGFETWIDFILAYRDLNDHLLTDPDRSHYFIEFEVITTHTHFGVVDRFI